VSRDPGAAEDARSDPELVERARAGDRRALEVLLRRHHDRLHLLCRRLCRDRGDAEDATQEALIAIVRGLPRYDGRAAFTTWSYRVTTNACLDQLRRRARRPLPSDVGGGDGVEPPPLVDDAGARAALDPETRALAAEGRTQLQAALADLPAEFRLPVVLRDVADLDYAEIGELLGLPPGTVRSRISRGRARLAEALSDLRAGTGNQDRRGDVRPGGPT
jgi:RNA polymerase sigma-70 factor (ECF subfamily)